MAGDPMNKSTYNLFFSLIGAGDPNLDADGSNRVTTLLLIVNDHNKYKTSELDKHIGNWMLLPVDKQLQDPREVLVPAHRHLTRTSSSRLRSTIS